MPTAERLIGQKFFGDEILEADELQDYAGFQIVTYSHGRLVISYQAAMEILGD